jgi:hypothetical protein
VPYEYSSLLVLPLHNITMLGGSRDRDRPSDAQTTTDSQTTWEPSEESSTTRETMADKVIKPSAIWQRRFGQINGGGWSPFHQQEGDAGSAALTPFVKDLLKAFEDSGLGPTA